MRYFPAYSTVGGGLAPTRGERRAVVAKKTLYKPVNLYYDNFDIVHGNIFVKIDNGLGAKKFFGHS